MSAAQPRITLVTPSYNQGEYLEQTILSVLEQNYPNLEYIIIDGGSTDNSVEIIKKYQKRLSYWVSEKDKGQSHAINKGLEKMTGDVFNWINSDDYLEKNALNTVAEVFKSNPQIKCCIGHLYIIRGGKKIWSGKQVNTADSDTSFIEGVIKQQSTFYAARAMMELGKLNEQLHFCMDLDLWYRFILKFGVKDVCIVKAPLANFRMQDNSKSLSKSVEFFNDRASIFHNMLIKKDEKKVSAFLEKTFSIEKEYSFDSPMQQLSIPTIYKAVAHFLLSDFGYVYTKEDFKMARAIVSILKELPVSFEGADKVVLDRIAENTTLNSWSLFKVKRKLKWLLGKNT